MLWFELIDAICKIVGALASIGTLIILVHRALPIIDQIHIQTNSLAQKAESAAHVSGVIEGRRLAAQEIKDHADLLERTIVPLTKIIKE